MPLLAFAASSAVTIQNFTFAPSAVTVNVGDSVAWTNLDAAAHSAKFGDRSTAVLSQGQSGTLLFTVAGTFPYICGIHGSSMQGTIVVRAAATPPPTPPPTAPPSTPLPTPVRTAPPTPAQTAPPTAAPTNPPTAAPTETATASPAQSASASPTSAAVETLTVSSSPSAAAVQVTPVPTAGGGPAPLLIGVAAIAIVALGALAFSLARRA